MEEPAMTEGAMGHLCERYKRLNLHNLQGLDGRLRRVQIRQETAESYGRGKRGYRVSAHHSGQQGQTVKGREADHYMGPREHSASFIVRDEPPAASPYPGGEGKLSTPFVSFFSLCCIGCLLLFSIFRYGLEK